MSITLGIPIVFLAEEEVKQGWNDDSPGMLKCPVCGFNYTHPQEPLFLQTDDYEFWAGRGSVIKVPFRCENGCHFTLCFGFHKGNTIAFWQDVTPDGQP